MNGARDVEMLPEEEDGEASAAASNSAPTGSAASVVSATDPVSPMEPSEARASDVAAVAFEVGRMAIVSPSVNRVG